MAPSMIGDIESSVVRYNYREIRKCTGNALIKRINIFRLNYFVKLDHLHKRVKRELNKPIA